MNVKVSIELPELHLEFAERMVREGGYGSLSELFEEHLRDMMLEEHDQPLSKRQLDSVMSMKEEIRRRMETPDDQWLSEEDSDEMFARLDARLSAKYGAGE
jgi:antitoxin ParD1/3/4